MSNPTRESIFGGITAEDFANWKHHPVTRLYLRYVLDFERMLADVHVGTVRTLVASPDPFSVGKAVGQMNALAEVGAPSYESIDHFYSLLLGGSEAQTTATEEKNAA